MDVLPWMKRACVVAFFLGVIGYLMFLERWLHALTKDRREWQNDTGAWLRVAEAPLLVILLSAIGYSLLCIAERFRLPRARSQHDEDFGDLPRRSPLPPV